MTPASPFHAGELAVQTRVGVRDKVAVAGLRMIRDAMPQQHRELFAKLPTLVVGSRDAQGRPWASMLAGRPGFIESPGERRLRIGALPAAGDPLARHIAVGAALGLLGIEPQTRRRNRMNGTVLDVDAAGFTVGVEQSFGNCPQYIQAREPQWVDAPAPTLAEDLAGGLHAAAQALVRRADTLFIASAAPAGVDVSHRGGLPGFVRLSHDTSGASVLSIPDYRGNNMFNTLGNIAAHPHAGLLFFDPASGDLLHLSGRAQIVWDGAELASFVGAQRLLKLSVDAGSWRPAALPLRWSAPEFAAQLQNPGGGT